MSTIDKAADLIGQDLARPLSERLADNLSEAGLLAPDLPQPDHIFEEGDARWVLTPETVVSTWDNKGNPYPRVLLDIGDGFLLHLEEARELAYMLLAAARWEEEKTND